MLKETLEVPCPFCKTGTVKVLKIASYMGHSSSSDDQGKKITYHRKAEQMKVLGLCGNCKKNVRELQREFDDPPGERKTHEEKMKRMEGIPGFNGVIYG